MEIAHGRSAARAIGLRGDDFDVGEERPARSSMLRISRGHDIMVDFMEPPKVLRYKGPMLRLGKSGARGIWRVSVAREKFQAELEADGLTKARCG